MRQEGYLNVEQISEYRQFDGLAYLILEEFPNLELEIKEDYEHYFVIHFICEDLEDVQELVSTTSYILVGEGVNKYTITLNLNE